MRTRFLLLAALGAALLLAWPTPAPAFNFSGCGNFELLAFNSITLEARQPGAPPIDGDILIADLKGVMKIGSHWTFSGAIFADTIIVNANSVVATCVANHILGPGTCLNTITPFVAPPGCTVQPFPPGIVVPQLPLPAQCLPGTAILVSTSQALAPGCYASIRVGKDQTLTLQAGSFYLVQSEFRTLHGGDVVSDTPGTRATIAARSVVTEAQILWRDLFVFQLSAQVGALHVFNGSVLENTVVVSPNKSIHLHTGSLLKNDSALAAVALEVEPIGTQFDAPPPVVCACPPGFRFAVPLCLAGVTCTAARECIPD